MTSKQKKQSGRGIRLQFGDLIEIPLIQKKHAYCQYIGKDKNGFGQIICVFDLATSKEMVPEEIVTHPLLFSPIHTWLLVAVRKEEFGWKKIGHYNIEKKNEVVKFLYGIPNEKKIVNCWFLLDENGKLHELGKTIPKKYQQLEENSVWSPQDIVKRIKNGGKIPYEGWKLDKYFEK